jgi:allantoinase
MLETTRLTHLRHRLTRPSHVTAPAFEADDAALREGTSCNADGITHAVGTPDGAAPVRRVRSRLKKDDAVWLTDTNAILETAGLK